MNDNKKKKNGYRFDSEFFCDAYIILRLYDEYDTRGRT